MGTVDGIFKGGEMTKEKRIEIAEGLFKDEHEMLLVKGKAYAGEGDSLANFKRNAERLGLTKYQIWAVYFNKHVDSINNAIQQNPNCPVDESEGLRGRIVDARTYLSILQCLLEEDRWSVEMTARIKRGTDYWLDANQSCHGAVSKTPPAYREDGWSGDGIGSVDNV